MNGPKRYKYSLAKEPQNPTTHDMQSHKASANIRTITQLYTAHVKMKTLRMLVLFLRNSSYSPV